MITSTSEYIEIPITDQIHEAVKREMKNKKIDTPLFFKSWSGSDKNTAAGFYVQEAIFNNKFQYLIKDTCYDHDAVLTFVPQITIDIKGKIQNAVKTPELDWVVTVDDFQLDYQHPKIYMFG